MTLHQTAFTDGDDPAPTALSSPILINIVDDDIFEEVEYFQARIVETSDELSVRIGPQDTVNVTIIDDESESFISQHSECPQRFFCRQFLPIKFIAVIVFTSLFLIASLLSLHTNYSSL